MDLVGNKQSGPYAFSQKCHKKAPSQNVAELSSKSASPSFFKFLLTYNFNYDQISKLKITKRNITICIYLFQ